MIIGTIRRILKEDLARAGEVPAWVDPFLGTLNQFIDTITVSLRGNLTFKDNFLCKVVTQTFTHGVELTLNPQSPNKVTGVLPVLASKSTDASESTRNVITGCGVNLKADGQIGVKIHFAGGASVKSDVTLIILFG